MENKNRKENQKTEQNPEIKDRDKKTNKEKNESEETVNDIKKEASTDKSEESTDFKLIKENEKLKKELDEQKDKYLRLYAEYDNYRKRAQKEKTDAYADAKSDAVKCFLPLLDNMEKAQEFAKDDKNLQVIIKQLNDILNELGVKAIESDGKPFDPNLHNAIAHEDDDSKDENKIIQTFQKGYMLGDKVIRHAIVKVLN
jgi:molecular chaperone GrpE